MEKNVSVISDQVNDTNSQLVGSTMTKAGRLAMELSHEKKRLKQELEELQTEYDEIKPTTPTGTTDWYVKCLQPPITLTSILHTNP
jgi:regulator of replication initiation timing